MSIEAKKSGRKIKIDFHEKELGIRIIPRLEFLHDLKNAIDKGIAYATGRIGISEQFWMYYPIFLEKKPNKTKLRVYEKHLVYHGFFQAGIFPADPDFFLKYNTIYIQKTKDMDCLGLILDRFMGPEIIRYYNLAGKFIYFKEIVPDRSVPSNPGNCYLPFFKDKKILLICPFANLLKQRAKKDIFEAVWAKTRRKWFYPACVDALEFPYGFEQETHEKYPNALVLLESITSEISRRDFDIALIAAAGLTVPIASFVKQMKKISICPGGEIQILFGVLGKRWRNWERWKRDYFNEWWIDMPDKYKPKKKQVCEGAYW